MLTMSQINDIRDLSRKGYGISKISSLTGKDRKTIRKYLEQDDFSPEPPVAKSRTSIVTPYIDIITEWLEEDQKHWSKQRHTAKRIHERLQEEYGFTGSYDSVQKFVHRIRTDIQTKGTQELVWEPGCAQVDFGEADFNEDTECVRRKYLTVSFPFSNDGYNQVFRGETANASARGFRISSTTSGVSLRFLCSTTQPALAAGSWIRYMRPSCLPGFVPITGSVSGSAIRMPDTRKATLRIK